MAVRIPLRLKISKKWKRKIADYILFVRESLLIRILIRIMNEYIMSLVSRLVL